MFGYLVNLRPHYVVGTNCKRYHVQDYKIISLFISRLKSVVNVYLAT